jgi:hemerythrin-like domain-containing protein
MLRDRSLIPLSHQHQHALALCVRIERALQAGSIDPSQWRKEIARDFKHEIQFHFAAEEQVLFPAARQFEQLGPLVDELIREHAQLRDHFIRAQQGLLNATDLGEFAKLLSSHIRKEERHLFEEMQKLLVPEELSAAGRELERALQEAVRVCGLRPLEQ